MSKDLELRNVTLDEVVTRKADNETVSFGGYIVKFNQASEDLGFIEYVDECAFDKTLEDESRNIFALYNHDWDKVLASTRNDTLKLSVDKTGLHFELTPKADTSYLRDVVALVEANELRGCSFGFVVNEDEWKTKDGKDIRVLKDIDLIEVTLTSNPAYESSEVSVRSYDNYKEEQRNKELELLKLQLDLIKLKQQ